jgi:hypothetical protein
LARKRAKGEKAIPAAKKPAAGTEPRTRIIDAITANLDADQKVAGMYLGVGMFVLVVVIVAVLVWQKPENLTFDKQAHLERAKAPYGTEKEPVGAEKRFGAGEREERGGAS